MTDLRDSLRQSRTGFFSYQNQPTLDNAALLLAFGPPVDPVAMELYIKMYGHLSWEKNVLALTRYLRKNYGSDFESSLTITHSVMQETFEVPLKAFTEAKLKTALLRIGSAGLQYENTV